MTDRRAFREFVRTHHPDVGGDPEVFATGLLRFRNSAPHPVGTFTQRWPQWVTSDDPRLQAPVVFRRTPHGLAAVTDRLRQRCCRHRRPPRVR